MIPYSRHAFIPDIPKTRQSDLNPDRVKIDPNSRHTQFHVFIETIDTPKPIITEIARPVINTTVNHIVEIYVPTVTNFVQVSPFVQLQNIYNRDIF